MSHRALWAEWNRLVPLARARGIRVRHIPREWAISRENAVRRVAWLRDQVGAISATEATASYVSHATITAAVPSLSEPFDATRQTFGVEFEVLMPEGMDRPSLAMIIRDHANVACHAETYNHSVRPSWKIVQDGSLGDYARGAEAVSPVLRGEEGLDEMKRVCEALVSAGCTVNKKCGFHVHVGARGRDVGFFRRLLRLYATNERLIDSFMAPSRRGTANLYCQPVTLPFAFDTMTLDSMRREFDSRYRKLNLQSYWRHGTVEFRHHQGTVEAKKAEMWVRVCLKMTAAAATQVGEGSTFWGQIGATVEEIHYYENRAARFAAREARRAAA